MKKISKPYSPPLQLSFFQRGSYLLEPHNNEKGKIYQYPPSMYSNKLLAELLRRLPCSTNLSIVLTFVLFFKYQYFYYYISSITNLDKHTTNQKPFKFCFPTHFYFAPEQLHKAGHILKEKKKIKKKPKQKRNSN